MVACHSSCQELLSCSAVGWVGNKQRQVECWDAPPGWLLKVAGGSDFYIAPAGQAIIPVKDKKFRAIRIQNGAAPSLTRLDREILVVPALVLALAQRGTWCLHASAALFGDQLMVFLGESGQGKSTLAAFLSTPEGSHWRLVADDILPVTIDSKGVIAWPSFPQLKLSSQAQPGVDLPEQILINRVCVLKEADDDSEPGLQLLPVDQSVQVFLKRIAGSRLFAPELLAKHLDFCAQACTRVPEYRLTYPHRREALDRLKELLEKLC